MPEPGHSSEPGDTRDPGDPAPLAALSRGKRAARAEAFEAALRLIGEKTQGDQQEELLEFAVTLAHITLTRRIIDKIATGVAMSTKSVRRFVIDSELGHQVRDEARQNVFAALLQEKFGDDPGLEAVARRMAHLPDAAALKAILNADHLSDLAD